MHHPSCYPEFRQRLKLLANIPAIISDFIPILLGGVLLLAFQATAAHSEEFPNNFSPTAGINEAYVEVAQLNRELGLFEVISSRSLTIKITASLAGVDLSTIDEFTEWGLELGGLNLAVNAKLSGTLSDDPNFNSSSGSRSVRIPVVSQNRLGDDVVYGSIAISWTQDAVSFSVGLIGYEDELLSIFGSDFVGQDDNSISRADQTLTFRFGPFEFARTLYYSGTAKTNVPVDPLVVEQIPFLSEYTISGSIDSTSPALTVSVPAKNQRFAVENILVTGTSTDNRAVLKVDVSVNGGVPIVGTLNGSNFSVPVTLLEGFNTLVVTATDVSGNTTSRTYTNIIYSTKSTLTVLTAGTASGTVFSPLLTVNGRRVLSLPYNPASGANPQSVTREVESGTKLYALAVPARGKVFGGWFGSSARNPALKWYTEGINFSMEPNLSLTARFEDNPFPPLAGAYGGVANGTVSSSRGVLSIVLSRFGAFTGVARVGNAPIGFVGKFLSDGTWKGKAFRGRQSFDVDFSLVSAAGVDPQIVGTITGNGLTIPITVDLNPWRPQTLELGGEAGTYNFLIEPSQLNLDPNVPIGIGWGKTIISKLGQVAAFGKLGDSTPFSFGATVMRRNTAVSGPAQFRYQFPFSYPLQGGLGRIQGDSLLDLANPAHDLSGDLAWAEPVSPVPLDANSFSGQVRLTGARYQVPPRNTQVLNSSNAGNLKLTLTAPSASFRGISIPSLAFATTISVRTNNVSQPTSLAERPLLAFNPASGFFSGSYFNAALKRQLLFSGAAVPSKLNRAGGSFVRFVRTGSVALESAASSSASVISEPAKTRVDSVASMRLQRVLGESGGQEFVRVAVGGRVPTGGWTGTEVREVSVSSGQDPTSSTVLELELVAVAPTGLVTQAFADVAAEGLFPIRAGVTQVRVLAASNLLTEPIP